MKFGVFDQNDYSGRPVAQQYEERLTLAELYEELGFHIYQMSEHHGTPLSTAPSPSVFLAALTQRTKTLRLSPLVYLLPIYHPMRLAEEICMLDQLSNGRFEFGVGRGASPYELGYLGASEESAMEMYVESFNILRQALTEGRLNHNGKYWKFDDVHMSIRPVQAPCPPIWYAAASPDAAAWPAQNRLNLICAGPPERIRLITDRYRSEQRALPGISPQPNLVGINRYIVVAPTDKEAMNLAQRAWPVFFASFIKLWHRYGGEPKNFKLPSTLEPLLANGLAVVGSPDHVRSILEQQVRDSGVNYLSGTFAFGDLTFEEVSASVRLFADDVMPALRRVYETSGAGLEVAV